MNEALDPQALILARPYSPPTAPVGVDERAPRTAHVWIASVSSFFTLMVLMVAILIALEADFSRLRLSLKLFKALVVFAAFSLLGGIAVLPLKGIKWYWAALLGPLVSIAALALVSFMIDFVTTNFLDPEV